MLAVRRLVHLSLMEQLLHSWRSIASVIVMAFGTSMLIQRIGAGGNVSHSIFALAAAVTAGAAIYTGSLALLWIAAGRPPGVEAIALHAAQALVAALKGRFRGVLSRNNSRP
jgi:hypothetical protein